MSTRENILEYLKRELIGPDPVKPHVQENNEEILINEPPRLRYSAGILFPSPDAGGSGITYKKSDSTTDEEDEIIKNNSDKMDEDPVKVGDNKTPSDVAGDYEEELGLANSFLPSAMGLSCFSGIPKEGFIVKVNYAVYEIRQYSYQRNDRTITKKSYFRIPLNDELKIKPSDMPMVFGDAKDFDLKDSQEKKTGLKLNIRNRTFKNLTEDKVYLFTFTLINSNSGSEETINNEKCFFQVSFSVEAINEEKCFYPYKTVTSKSDKEDEKSNQLLYRNKKIFAVGHGCSPTWDIASKERIYRINVDVLPEFEIKPIIPNKLPGTPLNMFELSDLSSANIPDILGKLNNEYEKWIR